MKTKVNVLLYLNKSEYIVIYTFFKQMPRCNLFFYTCKQINKTKLILIEENIIDMLASLTYE